MDQQSQRLISRLSLLSYILQNISGSSVHPTFLRGRWSRLNFRVHISRHIQTVQARHLRETTICRTCQVAAPTSALHGISKGSLVSYSVFLCEIPFAKRGQHCHVIMVLIGSLITFKMANLYICSRINCSVVAFRSPGTLVCELTSVNLSQICLPGHLKQIVWAQILLCYISHCIGGSSIGKRCTKWVCKSNGYYSLKSDAARDAWQP